MADLQEFAKTMKSLRNSRGLTQIEAAEKIGLNRGTIIRWEKGEGVPEMENITAAADFYGVSARSLAAKAGIDMPEHRYSADVAAFIEQKEQSLPEKDRLRFRKTILATVEAVAAGFAA